MSDEQAEYAGGDEYLTPVEPEADPNEFGDMDPADAVDESDTALTEDDESQS